jgi:glycosyltransferase involved in cell wall biosynthesis
LETSPLVSVVIATLGERDTLSRALSSVFSQSYSNWEVVIVCKNDVDLEEYDEVFIEKIRVRRQVESGIYQNFNLGITSAKGSLIAILNDDDWYEPSFLENAVKGIIQSKSDGVYGDTLLHDRKLRSRLLKSRENLCEKILFDFLGAYHTTFVLRKECFLRFGLFRYETSSGKRMELANDYEWFISALLGGLNLSKSEMIVGNFSWGGASSLQRRKLIKEGRHIASSYTKNRLHKLFITFVWQSRLAYNTIKLVRD